MKVKTAFKVIFSSYEQSADTLRLMKQSAGFSFCGCYKYNRQRVNSVLHRSDGLASLLKRVENHN
jgi:hypothetical protein